MTFSWKLVPRSSLHRWLGCSGWLLQWLCPDWDPSRWQHQDLLARRSPRQGQPHQTWWSRRCPRPRLPLRRWLLCPRCLRQSRLLSTFTDLITVISMMKWPKIIYILCKMMILKIKNLSKIYFETDYGNWALLFFDYLNLFSFLNLNNIKWVRLVS